MSRTVELDKQTASEVSTEALRQLVEWMKQTGEFVKEQSPLLAQEIINVGYLSYGFTLLVMTVLFVAFVYTTRYCWSKSDLHDEDTVGWQIGFALSLMGIAGFLAGVCFNIYGLISLFIAPRLYILEQVAKIIKQ